MNQNLKVESVQIKVNIQHPFTGDIGLELTSPSGTKSILLNVNNSFQDAVNIQNMVLLSNMFHGENSQGSWTLKVIDGSAGDTGVLQNWELKINGGASNQLNF